MTDSPFNHRRTMALLSALGTDLSCDCPSCRVVHALVFDCLRMPDAVIIDPALHALSSAAARFIVAASKGGTEQAQAALDGFIADFNKQLVRRGILAAEEEPPPAPGPAPMPTPAQPAEPERKTIDDDVLAKLKTFNKVAC